MDSGGVATRLPRPIGWPAFDLLDGVRILDFTNSIAGPYATLLLADLGADVVKVEHPHNGDDTRAWGPPFLGEDSLWYLSVNRNKSSVALDVRDLEVRPVVERLLGAADVVVVNLRPSVQQRLRLDAQAVRAIRPDVIHCSITGFGLTGGRREMACYDLIAEGHSGVMDLTGEPDGPPQKIGTPAADLLAGMDAAFGVVAALLDRERTGRGHDLDISLTESMTRFLAPRLMAYLGSGEAPRRSGGRDSVIAIYQVFDTQDDPITLGLGNDRIFGRFCEAIERPAWVDVSRYADNRERRTHRHELVAMIQEVLLAKPRQHWLELFDRYEVPAGPINGVHDVVADAALLQRGMFYAIEQDGESIPQVGTGWHLNGMPNGRASRPPALGADTDEVLDRWSVKVKA
jgi:crotonobetainyl-CoA:carnitine CoA-transferase CaiB-like acyl-CoA transferase